MLAPVSPDVRDTAPMSAFEQTALAQSMSHHLLRSGTTLPSQLDATEFSSAAQELTDIMPQATRDTQVRGDALEATGDG